MLLRQTPGLHHWIILRPSTLLSWLCPLATTAGNSVDHHRCFCLLNLVSLLDFLNIQFRLFESGLWFVRLNTGISNWILHPKPVVDECLEVTVKHMVMCFSLFIALCWHYGIATAKFTYIWWMHVKQMDICCDSICKLLACSKMYTLLLY